MSEGQKAADQTKSVFSQLGQAGEDIRKNVNSYADDLVGGNNAQGRHDIHPDAKRAGDELHKGVNDAGKKLDEFLASKKK